MNAITKQTIADMTREQLIELALKLNLRCVSLDAKLQDAEGELEENLKIIEDLEDQVQELVGDKETLESDLEEANEKLEEIESILEK